MGEEREKEIQRGRGKYYPASSEEQWEKRAGVNGAYLLKGPFTAEYICSDIAAIGPQADQGTAWVSPAR